MNKACLALLHFLSYIFLVSGTALSYTFNNHVNASVFFHHYKRHPIEFEQSIVVVNPAIVSKKLVTYSQPEISFEVSSFVRQDLMDICRHLI